MTQLPIKRVFRSDRAQLDPNAWPAAVPSVAHLLRHGLQLGQLTILVGENGSGKSTIVEGIAGAYGMSPEGGSTQGRHSTRPTESELWRDLTITREAGASHWGFFLRAETMHGLYTYLEANPGRTEPRFHEMSHGESFLAILEHRFDSPGLYLLDEPESALSFAGCLALVGVLAQITRSETAQAIVATHSPIVAAVPGARILEVGEWGLREVEWAELELVQNWRSFLDAPGRYLRHVV